MSLMRKKDESRLYTQCDSFIPKWDIWHFQKGQQLLWQYNIGSFKSELPILCRVRFFLRLRYVYKAARFLSCIVTDIVNMSATISNTVSSKLTLPLCAWIVSSIRCPPAGLLLATLLKKLQTDLHECFSRGWRLLHLILLGWLCIGTLLLPRGRVKRFLIRNKYGILLFV